MKITEIGPNALQVSTLCVGTSPLGSLPDTYGYAVDEARAVATVERILESPINFLDTSNEYSQGESERRIGIALKRAGGAPDNFVIATKADPAAGSRTFDRERVLQSFRESAERLGVDTFGVYYLHDPERFPFEYLTGPDGALSGMLELKEKGLVGAIGVAGGDITEMHRYVETGKFDILLNHNQYTLLDRSADALIDHAIAAGMDFVNAAPYASGILAKPAAAKPRFWYSVPSEAVIARTERIREICDRHGVSLPAVALQFSTRDRRITSTVVGVSTPERVDELVENEQATIPSEIWAEIDSVTTEQ
ncbi:aldo/keto reductase [Streptomyces sp. NPDC058656]|uniref:aldo/keto reductase n=1 Tax=unclassified Streptomyces TaxID=2593676 RepID=UPI003664F48C